MSIAAAVASGRLDHLIRFSRQTLSNGLRDSPMAFRPAERGHSCAPRLSRARRPPPITPSWAWPWRGPPSEGAFSTVTGTYNYWLVLLSVAVAVFVSFTALSLSARVARAAGKTAQTWAAG